MRGKACDGGGRHRTLLPEQVLDRHGHLISPVTGIVKQIQHDSRGPAFFNSFRSGANVAAQLTDVHALRGALRVSNGGKGTTAVLGPGGRVARGRQAALRQFPVVDGVLRLDWLTEIGVGEFLFSY